MRLGIREQFGAGLKQGLSLPRVCRARPTTGQAGLSSPERPRVFTAGTTLANPLGGALR